MSSLLKTKRLIWAAVFALVALVALFSRLSGKRYVAAVEAIEHTLSVDVAISGVLSLLKDAETGQRGYLLAGDPQFLEPLAAAHREIPAMFAQLQALTRDDAEQTARLRTIERLMRDKYAVIDETVNQRREGKLELAVSAVQRGHGKRLMDAMRAEFARMREREAQTLQLRKERARAAQRSATWGI